jgi:hypothetical protein
MATQGLVTVRSGKRVLMKIVAGDEGYNAQKVADKLRKFWPVGANKAYELASKAGFGCEECLVVMTDTEIIFEGDEDIHPRYRKTFHQPKFNPRWKYGTADYIVVASV